MASIFDIEERTTLTFIDDLIDAEYGNVHRVFPHIGLKFQDSGFYGRYGLRFRDQRGYYDWPLTLTWKQKPTPIDPGQPDHMIFYQLNREYHKHAVHTVEEVQLIIEAVKQEYHANGYVDA